MASSEREKKMNSKAPGMVIALVFAAVLAASPSSARAQEGAAPAPPAVSGGGGGGAAVRAGYLTFPLEAGGGFIFGSSRQLHCAYSMQPRDTEYYFSSVPKVGVDNGFPQAGANFLAGLA